MQKRISRRFFLKTGFSSVATVTPYLLRPSSAEAAGFQNLGAFWKKSSSGPGLFRVTQVFAQAATTGGVGGFRVTQAFAQAATTGGPGEFRVTQAFAQAATTGGVGGFRVTQVFAQVAAKP
ncbi:MAG: hypothetical protein ACXVB4_17495 [Pseudobdellovibrionaceae bacterium]